ncbi:MAG: glycosyltransferase family 1 protein, partial [Ilumatobacteraceae bacterium]
AGRVLRRAVLRGAHVQAGAAATAAAAADLLDTDRVTVIHLGPPALPGTGLPVAPVPVTPPGTDTLRSDPAGGRPYLIAVGTTERRKDVPALVAAFDRLVGGRSDRRDLHLVVAGAAGDDHDRVVEAVGRLAPMVRDRVHLLGAVDAATRDRLVRDARALVYPSLDEGFGFPVLEAQQLGTPVVARAVGSVPEVGGDGVELADGLAIDALAASIARVIDDEARRAELVAAGERNLTRFSWERAADELVTLYRRAVDESRAA